MEAHFYASTSISDWLLVLVPRSTSWWPKRQYEILPIFFCSKKAILEGYGEKRKEKYDEIRAKYGLKGDPNNPFEEDEPAEKPVKKSFFSKLKKK